MLFIGNMFDWGAQAVSQILETDKNFGLDEALQRIQQRPWLIDCLDQWLDRLQVHYLQTLHIVHFITILISRVLHTSVSPFSQIIQELI